MKEPQLPVFRPQEAGLEKMLGSLEAQIMQALWDAGQPLNVQGVRDQFVASDKELAYTTVMTTLGRLHTKGLLHREMRGKAYFYLPRVSRKELTDSMARQVISGLVSAVAEPALAYFVEALEEQSPENLDRLAEILERKRAARRGQ